MTLYLDLPSPRGQPDRVVSQFGAEVLPAPPGGLDEVPTDKALVGVSDPGDYEAAGCIPAEADSRRGLIAPTEPEDLAAHGAGDRRPIVPWRGGRQAAPAVVLGA